MIIVEICQNHNGDQSLLFEMVKQASQAGAHFCKIQSFFADDLSEGWAFDKERLKKLELDWETHAKFIQACQAQNLIPMTSVYTTRYAQLLHDAGFKYVKIGSAQAMDDKLILFYLALGFKVILSTGGHDPKKLPRFHGLEGVLHCVSQYPASPYEANLIRMIELKRYFPNTAVGFSSHIDPTHRDWYIPLEVASFMGATYIECHYTALPRFKTKDGPVSLDFQQLKYICDFDRLPFEKKQEKLGEFGVIFAPQCQEERNLIGRYQSRWKA